MALLMSGRAHLMLLGHALAHFIETYIFELACQSAALHNGIIIITHNPLGNQNSGLIAARIRCGYREITLASCFSLLLYMSIFVCFYDNVELSRMRCNSTKRLSTVARWRHVNFFIVMYAVCRILDKLHIFSNILCTCNICSKMWAQI